MSKDRTGAGELGERLRKSRTSSHLSLRHVAERSGLHNAYLSQLETGRIAHPSPSVLEKVATGYELDFADLLRWAGYTRERPDAASINREIALSTVSSLDDPSDQELEAIKAIVDVLRKQRSAPFTAPSDMPLDQPTEAEIHRYTDALLREADALGGRPTPLEDIRAAARLTLTGELTLDAADRARLTERFGKWVNRAWRRLQGTFDFRTSEIWIKPDLYPMKRRFVLSHEIGHAILPAHKRTFAFVDDFTCLPPHARELFEREANQAAVDILFQGDQGVEEFDGSRPSLGEIRRVAEAFGASIAATARYVTERSRHSVAVAVAHHKTNGGLGPLHLYTSSAFERAFGWRDGRPANPVLATAIHTAYLLRTSVGKVEHDVGVAENRRGEARLLDIESTNTSYAAIALIVPRSHVRAATRRLARRSRDVHQAHRDRPFR